VAAGLSADSAAWGPVVFDTGGESCLLDI